MFRPSSLSPTDAQDMRASSSTFTPRRSPPVISMPLALHVAPNTSNPKNMRGWGGNRPAAPLATSLAASTTTAKSGWNDRRESQGIGGEISQSGAKVNGGPGTATHIRFSHQGGPPPPPSSRSAVASTQQPKESDREKMHWGAPTWFLLHTLAEKVDEHIFFTDATFRYDFLTTIGTICTNLPCPSCSQHAKQYLESHGNFMYIRTKQELKDAFFTFHNIVNARKGYAQFSRDQLDPMYSAAIFKNIVYNFFMFYGDRVKNEKYMANEMFRERVIQKLRLWFTENQHYFTNNEF